MDSEGLEARIKALTTLIHALRPQNVTPTPGSAGSANAQAYHHVATLLTREVEDGGPGRSIAVTGVNTAVLQVVPLYIHPISHLSLH
jgi:hypothetical protein